MTFPQSVLARTDLRAPQTVASEAPATLLWAWRGHGAPAPLRHSPQPLPTLHGILKSIKKLHVVILTKEKKTCIMKWKDKLQQKYNYWSTSFPSFFSLPELGPHRTAQLPCCHKTKFWSTAAYPAPPMGNNTALYIWGIAMRHSMDWARKLSQKSEVWMVKINMEMHYVPK